MGLINNQILGIFILLLHLHEKVLCGFTCISGALGTSATQVACETGNNFCQVMDQKFCFFFKYLTWFTFKIVTDVSTSPATVTASCATYCPSSTSSLNSICYIGANSNKIGFYCFVGDLYSSGQGGSPIMCNSGYYCQVN